MAADSNSLEQSETRMATYKKTARKSVAQFFGVDNEQKDVDKWEKRHLRLANSIGIGLKEEFISDISSSHLSSPRNRKKSVAKLTMEGFKNMKPQSKHETERKYSIKVEADLARKLNASLKESSKKQEASKILSKQEIDRKQSLRPEEQLAHRLSVAFKEDGSKSLDVAQCVAEKFSAEEHTFFDETASPHYPATSLVVPKSESTPKKVSQEPVGYRKINQQIITSAAKEGKRQIGMGTMGHFLRRRLKSVVVMDKEIKKQLDDFEDYRPFFSYWVTFVQIVIFVVSIAVYGIAPIGIGKSVVYSNVHMPNLAIQTESYIEKRNMWIGPRQADLIHLGAKYSPCMRFDQNLMEAIKLDKDEEKESACCIRNDGSGCVQSVEAGCSNTLSSWFKWGLNEIPDHGIRRSGSVCGQDPRFCNLPSSTPPFEWADDITLWPICQETIRPNQSLASPKHRHMNCEILGHPCCHGIQGECVITTKEHCDLLRGFFHDEAFLCSQICCFEEICGMIPFANPAHPDQFYRLWTSLFLHSGVLHLAVSVTFQMWIMRDLEKLMGAIRTSIIYIGSGVAGNLASCIFIPYTVQVGPSGSHFGIAACLLVEVVQTYQMYKHPFIAFMRLVSPFLVLFIVGLLPWFDNWAHIFGFLFGFLLAFSLMPYVTFGQFDKHRKLMTIIVCLGGAIFLFALLVLVFYQAPLADCSWCIYLNCIPFTEDFCENMGVSIKKNATYSKYSVIH